MRIPLYSVLFTCLFYQAGFCQHSLGISANYNIPLNDFNTFAKASPGFEAGWRFQKERYFFSAGFFTANHKLDSLGFKYERPGEGQIQVLFNDRWKNYGLEAGGGFFLSKKLLRPYLGINIGYLRGNRQVTEKGKNGTSGSEGPFPRWAIIPKAGAQVTIGKRLVFVSEAKYNYNFRRKENTFQFYTDVRTTTHDPFFQLSTGLHFIFD